MFASARRIIAIDIENICGKPKLAESDIARARSVIETIAEPKGNDAVVIGTSHSNNWLAAASAWPGALQAFQRRHNGADLAIINALAAYDYGAVSELIFFGGDGIFATTLARVAQTGVPVHVFANAGNISQRIYQAAGYNQSMDITPLRVRV